MDDPYDRFDVFSTPSSSRRSFVNEIGHLSARRAAEELARTLRRTARSIDRDPEGVLVESPEEDPGGVWRVSWEEGPLDWGMYLSSGESIWFAEPRRSRPLGVGVAGPEVDLMSSDQWYCETREGFDICFMPM